MKERTEDLIEAFTKVAKQHSEAFSHVNGADPEWPKWYADRLASPLGMILDKTFDSVELARILDNLDKEYTKNQPRISWQEFYSEYFESHS